jgi:Anticodon binding domain
VSVTVEALAVAMQRWGFLEDPAPPAAHAWIATFLEAYGSRVSAIDDAFPLVEALRAEACTIPALELERLRSRDVLFFIDAVGQYVDDQPELRDLPLAADLAAIASEFGLRTKDAMAAVRMTLTGEKEGPALELLFPLLGHDRILIRVGAVNSKLLHGRGLEPIAFGPDGAPFEPIRGERPADENPGAPAG